MRSNHQDKITDLTNCAYIWGCFTVFAAGIQIIFQNAYEIWLSLSYAVTHNTPFHISVQQKLTFLASLQSLFWQSLPMFGSSAPHMLTTCPICFSWLDLWMKSYIYLCSPSAYPFGLSDISWIFTILPTFWITPFDNKWICNWWAVLFNCCKHVKIMM